MLVDGDATREAILRAFREHLVRPAVRGDIGVFYFSGHGSQVVNSTCPEPDCKDETIVPSDANLGTPDIRDKEWCRLFNDVLDKGALLTSFLDACHSGSLTRGQQKARFLPPDSRDATSLYPVDVEDPRGVPEDRGALTFPASQDFQKAIETVDGQGTPHGGFGLALIKTLRTVPSNESAQSIFRRIRAHIQSEGRLQEPNIQGTPERQSLPLLGIGNGLPTPLTVAVLKVEQDGTCILQRGRALGLCPGCELKKVDDGVGGSTGVRVRVDAVDELSQ